MRRCAVCRKVLNDREALRLQCAAGQWAVTRLYGFSGAATVPLASAAAVGASPPDPPNRGATLATAAESAHNSAPREPPAFQSAARSHRSGSPFSVGTGRGANLCAKVNCLRIGWLRFGSCAGRPPRTDPPADSSADPVVDPLVAWVERVAAAADQCADRRSAGLRRRGLDASEDAGVAQLRELAVGLAAGARSLALAPQAREGKGRQRRGQGSRARE